MTADLSARLDEIEARAGRLTAGDLLHKLHFEECRELCQRHGMKEALVNWIEHDVIDLPLLRFGCLRKDAEGRTLVDEETQEIARFTVERPLIGDLPAWWPR